MTSQRAQAWNLLLVSLVEDKDLLSTVLLPEDVEEFRADLKKMLDAPSEQVAEVMHREFENWVLDGRPFPEDNTSLSAILCWFMSCMATAAHVLQQAAKVLH